MGANPLLGPLKLERGGPWYLNLFGTKWHSLRSLPFPGPEKSRFSVPTISSGPQNGFARIKIITSRAIYTIGTFHLSKILTIALQSTQQTFGWKILNFSYTYGPKFERFNIVAIFLFRGNQYKYRKRKVFRLLFYIYS